MEIRCPGCAHPITIPKELCGEDESRSHYTITAVDCPNCGSVSVGPAYWKTISLASPPEEADIRQVAHFELIKKLGQGGFGAVWLAHDLALGREVALKIPTSKGHEADSLLYEAQTAASLRHPNIVPIFEVGNAGGRAFIASQYIEGLTLRDFLSSGRPPIVRTVELLTCVADALHHAHEHGVVHRDVKPANILVNQEGQPFVTDFGIAKRISPDSTITSDGRIVGTARYMSPEQASGRSRETDRRSDVYAVGVILFEMLTGDTPFRGNVRALLHQKTFEEAPSPRRLDPNLPKDLETICLKCLEREPAKRYQTALELADELKRFRAGEPIQARPITSLERVWRRCRRRPVVASLIASLFLSLSLGLLGVSYFWLQARASEQRTEQSLYRAQMNLAATYLDSGDIAGVRRALGRFGPDTPQSGLRGFEWHYFDHATAGILDVANQGNVVEDVAITRDGDLCAACGNDKHVRVWNSKTGELIRTLAVEAGQVNSVAFSPTSSQLAGGSSDGRYWIWNPLKDDRPLQNRKHGPPIALVRYSPNGKQLLTAGKSGAVRVWDLDKETLVVEIPTGGSGMKDARFSPDGSQVAVASGDGMVRIWTVATRERVHTLDPNPSIEAIAYSADGSTLATGGVTGHLKIWSVEGESMEHSHEMTWSIGGLEFDKESRVLAITSRLGTLHFYDVDGRRELAKVKTHNLSTGRLARSADGKWLAVGSGDGAVKLVRMRSAMRPNVYWHDDSVRAVAFLPEGNQLVAGDIQGNLKIWDFESAESLPLETLSNKPLTTLAIQPRGKLIAAGGGGSLCGLWDRESHKLVDKIDLGEHGVISLAFTPSGRRLALAVRDGPVLIYDVDDWKQPRLKIDQLEAPATAVVFSANERFLIAAHLNGQVNVFDASNGQLREHLLHLRTIPIAMCLCEQGRLLAVGTDAGEIHLWDLASNHSRHVFKGHSGRIASLAPFPKGHTLVSASRDRDLKLWDTASGEPITTLCGHDKQIFSVAVSPDGNTLASGGLLGEVRIWRALSKQ